MMMLKIQFHLRFQEVKKKLVMKLSNSPRKPITRELT